MAIIINSLTPNSPVTVSNNSSVTFSCSMTEDQFGSGFVITAVQWQVSTNGGATWNNAPFTSDNLIDDGLGNYTSSYATGNLNSSNNGDEYRITITSSSGAIVNSNEYLITNGYPTDIGTRVISIVTNPSIIVLDENYNPYYIVPDNGTVTLNASATYANRPIASPSDLVNLTITWQKSYNYDPENPSTATWTNVSAGTVTNEAVYTINVTTFIFDTTTSSYGKNSQLVISSIKFNLNNVYFRPVYTSTNVNNSPLISTNLTYILVSPTIAIITQPGIATNNTKDTMLCYGSGNTSNGIYPSDTGGDFRSSISAITSASSSSTLSYQWQFRAFNDGFAGNLNENITQTNDVNAWLSIENGELLKYFIIQQKDSTLILRRVQYFDRYRFRCVITGTLSEPEVTSDYHEIYVKDNISSLQNISTPIVTLEDYYGDVVDRNLLTDKPTRTVLISSSIDIANYLGQEGNIELQWERRNPGSSTWASIGTADYISYFRSTGNASSPGTVSDNYISSYTTPPLRISLDDDASYRLRAKSSAVYSYNSGNSYPNKKTLSTWYSNIATLDVYKEIFITSQPSSIDAFVTSTVSFSANFTITSGLSTVTYKWQRANSVGGLPDTASIIDVSNGPLFGVTGENVVSGSTGTGVSSATLVITNITDSLKNYFFRVIISDIGALSSITSDFARVRVQQDKFIQISSINDYYVQEFSNVSWTVNASTLSQGAITYQWQKSTNFAQSLAGATWNNLSNVSNIQGVNTNTLSISNVQNPEDNGYYRLRMVSAGGVVAFSNVVGLFISVVEISFTKNFPTSLTFVEGETIVTPFEVIAFASNGDDISYRWEYKKPGETSFSPFGPGVDFQSDTSNPYIPNPFFKQDNWNGAQIRVRLSIPSFASGTYVYSNVATLNVNRRFFYFADSPIKTVSAGTPLSVNLSPSYTGNATPTYAWQYSTNGGTTWASVSNIGGVANSDTLFVPTVLLTYNGYLIRCLVTLSLVDQFVYTRNNTQIVDNFSGFGYTATIQLNVVNAPIFPIYFSQEIGRTGAAVGTVICVPKPSGYVDQNLTATTDDIDQWEVSISGNPLSTGSNSSIVASGSIYDANKTILQKRGYFTQNWVDSNYKSPKWRIDKDRFPGFIELRGQWLLKSEFPLLYEIIGNIYGSTTTSFKLPNPYGKKIMGTGAVNSQTGRTSVIPLYDAAGVSGGDRLAPGTIGGVWNYEKSRQLPPGSPGISGEIDGTAGVTDPSTFTLGNYTTTGWTESTATANTFFSGSFRYTVGPIGEAVLSTPAPHTHSGVSIGVRSRTAAYSCTYAAPINPPFNESSDTGGQILDGPSGIDANSRGRTHTHGISDNFISSGNNANSNHATGKGDTSAGDSWTEIINIDFRRGQESAKSLNTFLDTVDVTLSNASRTKFDSNLSFYLRNSETIPIISNYFRVKWMIKAY